MAAGGMRKSVVAAAIVVVVLAAGAGAYAMGVDPRSTSRVGPLGTAAAPNDGSVGQGAAAQPGMSGSASPSASTSTSASASAGPAAARPQGGPNCARSPSSCGYPDATNTGWRHTGVKLKVVTADPYYVNEPGTVVDGLDIKGCVYVRAKNVTIKRSRITCSDQPMIKNWEPDGHGGLTYIGAGLLVEDVEFDGGGDPEAHGMAFSQYTVRRSDFHNLGAAVKLGDNVVIEDNYVHDIAARSDSHVGGFPSDGGVGITIRHNTVMLNSTNGYAIAIYNQIPAGSVVKNVVIDRNLLAGGNYILYCGAPGQIAPNLRVTSNRFSNSLYPKGGNFGPSANCDGAAAWSGNIWDDSMAELKP